MARHRNKDWNLGGDESGGISRDVNHTHIQTAVLMDIREELQKLNALLHCQNFIDIPRKLDRIAAKLPTRRKRKAT